MKTPRQFPTSYDIYSIYNNSQFQKLRKNKTSFIPKLLRTLLKTYPDLQKFVAEKSLSNEFLKKFFQKHIFKMKRYEINAANSPKTFVSGNPLETGTIDPSGPTVISQDCAQPSLREQISINEFEKRRFCIANVWSGFPTFGSVYSTYKLEIIQTLKRDNKEFISAMLQILIQKYPRLKTLFLELASSDSDITKTFSYIIREAENTEHCCKQEKREFFSTVLKTEIISNIIKQGTHSEKGEDKEINESLPTSVKKVAARSTVYNDISSSPNKKNVKNFHFDFKFKPVTSENKAHLSEYLKNLKIKYALIQSKLAKSNHQQEHLEKKLKILFMKQRNYKYKIKKYRKEMIEFDTAELNK